MSNFAIEIQNISKKYMIGTDRSSSYKTLKESFSDSIKNLMHGNLQGQVREFWALKNISFSIDVGDKVALIGHNGAGKSTLLKILSQVTDPTSGKIVINGKVSSLLEVGTGFHTELTGRENIYLNGSIMGMTKNDIKRQLDEIVDFSGVGDFLNTPVKRYSSGMQARLGFAIAAHLQSDILIVDEVLAVGDIAFQKKCLGKMDEVSRKSGKTIIFVSHNIHAVKSLCNKGILLKKGRLIMSDDIDITCEEYLNSELKNVDYLFKKKSSLLDLVRVDTPSQIASGEDWVIKLILKSNAPLKNLNIDFSLYNREILPISHFRGREFCEDFNVNTGEFSITLTTKNVFLNNGHYLLGVFISNSKGDVLLDVLDIPAGSVHKAPSYISNAAIISNETQIYVKN